MSFITASGCVLITQLCPTLCDPMDCRPPGSSVHGILQARILEWVAIPFSRGSSQPRDGTWVSSIAGRFFTFWAAKEAHSCFYWDLNIGPELAQRAPHGSFNIFFCLSVLRQNCRIKCKKCFDFLCLPVPSSSSKNAIAFLLLLLYLFIYFCLFSIFWLHHSAHRQDLNSLTRDQTHAPFSGSAMS